MSVKKADKNSVSNKITFSATIILIAVLLAFGGISYLMARLRTETDSLDDMNNAANVISGIVSDYMSPKIESVKSLAQSKTATEFISDSGSANSSEELQSVDSYEDICGTLNDMALSSNDIVSAWIVSESGKTLLANNERFVSAQELALDSLSWYKEIDFENSAKTVFCSAKSTSLFDKGTETVSVIAPVYVSGNIIGYVGMEIQIDAVAEILEQYTLNSGCYPVISCGYGSVVYSPSGSDFTNKFNITEAPLINVLIQSSSMLDGIDSYSNGSGLADKVYFNVDNTAIPNWTILILFDSNVLNGGIYTFFLIETIVLACIIALAAIAVKNKVKSETAAVPVICEAIGQISNGGSCRLDDADIGTNKELTEAVQKLGGIAEIIREKDELIRQFTSNDTLTGLPNRMSLYHKIEELIGRSKSPDATPNSERFAIMFVDIDNFKWLNETLGHNFGDAVLRTFSEVLLSTLNKLGDIYRFSGDEFIILVQFGSDYSIIHKVIKLLQTAFANQIRVMTDNIYIKFSVGVSIYPEDDVTADMLLRDADLALHRAKDNGKDRVSFYTNAAKRQNFSKAAIAQQISTALKGNEMYLNYQPIISTNNCDIHGFEVLLRWNSPLFGRIPPTEFITVAEETGDIIQIGMWIFENSCRFLKYLCDNYRDDIIMSINVSPVQLRRADYLETIQHVIEITQVKPRNIQIEITESTLIDFIDNDNSVIEKINDMGIALALDDFGTGYSSLNYLKNFPIKCLKIDKSFVDEINNNKRDQAITDSIIDLVHNLGIKTVAEGIETVGQYNFLKDMKCDYIQGFLMSKPLDEKDALEFVEKYDDLHKPDGHILAEHEKQLADEREQKQKSMSNDAPDDTDPNFVDETISK